MERSGILWGAELGEFWGVKWNSGWVDGWVLLEKWRRSGGNDSAGGGGWGWWVPKAGRSSRGPEKAREKGIGGGVPEVYCGLRRANSREGNSREERIEVGEWRFGRRQGVP